MNFQYPPDGQGKHGMRQAIRSSVTWVKDAFRRPSSAPPSPAHQGHLTLAESLYKNQSLSRSTTPLSTSAPPVELGQPSLTPGPSNHMSVPEAKIATKKGDKKSDKITRSQLTASLRILENGVGLFPPLKSAVGEFIGCLAIVQEATLNGVDYQRLALELEAMANTLNQCIKHQTACIKQKQGSGTVRRLAGAKNDQDDVLHHYRQVESVFRQIQCDLSMRTRSDVKKQLETTLLRNMSPVDDARYNSGYSTTIRRHRCTARTREAIHQALQDWTTNPKSQKIYWMNGMAGTGKTTIAYSYCEWLEATNRLGASFFCSRISSTCRSLGQIIPTLAYQLARFSPAFRSVLCTTLDHDPDAGKLNVVQQFEKLIYRPILDAKNAMPDNVVIVIDALDECDDTYSVRLLLDVLLKFAEGLPLKFFVSSRPEPMIRDRMMSQGDSSRFIVYLHDIEQSIVEEDIKKYLTEALGSMEHPPSLAQIELLANRSRNLFIYAATVVRYIYPDDTSIDSTARLESMLEATRPTKGKSSNRYEDLDLLYTTVLSAVFARRLEEEEKDGMRRVLSTVVCAREPIITATIALLAKLTERQVWSALQALRSVIHVPENSNLISTLHASFPEYMLDRSRSNGFCCDESKSNETMAHCCLKVMESELRFNICALESSYLTDDKVEDLEDRVSQFISPTLSYTCRYWASHLSLTPATSHTRDMLLDFLSNRLLFWMEVLSLSRCTGIGAPMMQQAQTWLRLENDRDEIQKQVSDARNFATWFAANPCSRSTPHIYISALSLCAKSSWVYQCYIQRTKGLVRVSISEHEEAVLAIWSVESPARSMAISVNGNHIATGTQDGSVLVYDTHTGAVVAGPLKGHRDLVNSVAFSPSGAHIASGSDDKTVIVWDALTGRMLTGPLRKHAAYVVCVAFSPDGKRVISGSGDPCITVWDSSTGAIVLGPLWGHTNTIWSVASSPNGKFIASGSEDRSIRLWDSRTGAVVTKLQGHQATVRMIAFSPDGSRLASCSDDATVQLWDTKARTNTGRPLIGHSGGIRSIAFSADNSRVVSGGSTEVIVWDTHTGSVALGPLSGHTGPVTSVVLSLNDSQVISASHDKTIRIWDIQSNSGTLDQQNGPELPISPTVFLLNHKQMVSNSSRGALRIWDMHTGTIIPREFEGQIESPIHALAACPQGALIAASTYAYTIQVWSVATGKLVFQSLKGHRSLVGCLAFSPDGGYLCSGSEYANISVWDIETGAMVGKPYQGHTGIVTSVAYSSDATHIASGAADHTVRIWDSSTGTLLHTLNGHKDSVSSVVFSPNGSHIVSGSVDGAIRKWGAKAGDCLGILFDPDLSNPVPFSNSDQLTSINWVCFSPDSTRIISGFGSSVRLIDSQGTELIHNLSLPRGEKIRWVGCSANDSDIISISTTEQTNAKQFVEESTLQPPPSPSIVRVWRAYARPDQSVSPFTPRDWTYEPDARVLSPEGLVMWIPPDLVPHLKAHIEVGSPSYYCPLVMSSDRSIDIGFTDLCIGDRWTECYKQNV